MNHSTLHEAAESIIGPLIQVNLHLSSRANMPCFRRSGDMQNMPSQLLLVLGGMD